MNKISVALIFRDEALNLPYWLDAVRGFADEIVAVDSGSGDNGPDLLRAAGARVEYNPWPGYGRQRNLACDLCGGDWILFLDADEWPDQAFVASMNQFKKDPEIEAGGYYIQMKVFFFGRFLRHGGFFPEHCLRLLKRGHGRWSEREIHESLLIDGPVGIFRPGYIHHHSYRNISDYLRRLDSYSTLAAREMLSRGQRGRPVKAFAHAFFNFVSRYFLRLGFWDGFAGYLAARLEATYTLSKYTKLWEMGRELTDKGEDGKRNG
ncbi:MAG: glycosyltransferase family 2 protein [Desulfarculales bacterium]|jgi:glycosyltransferase involved in cell wall biosynthesis|nr:glycosyltransferase family 2 protein [Desulfarculales bacterium]